jgi:hypothetical protein
MSQAYLQLRSQLYVGVPFLQSLNSGGEGTAAQVSSLIRAAGSYHSFYPVLSKIIALNNTEGLVSMPGKPKEGNFEKKRP